jgi:hypothetical protein
MTSRGRHDGVQGHPGVSTRTALALAALLAAACGGIDQPDLGTGQISGKLSNAQAGAYVYAFGAPQTKALVAADGSYTLKDVPLGTTQVVAYDGQSRAELVPVEVRPASATRLDHDASQMPLARTLTAVPRCSGNQSRQGARYTVQGTEFQDLAEGEVARLYPLPPGSFTLVTKLAGFKDSTVQVDVTPAADQSVDVALDTDTSDAQHQGCNSSGCAGGLTCDGKSGDCTGDGRSACLSCDASSQCASSTNGAGTRFDGACIAATGGAGNVCSHGCAADTDCPSGFACANAVCVAAAGCEGVLGAFGRSCQGKDDCAALADGTCVLPASRGGGSGSGTGYCTSRCATNADCPAQLGFTCDGTTSLCVH